MIDDTTTKTAKGTNHRESGDDYEGIIARLSDSWRLIECRDGIQWILQKGRRNGGETRWYSRLHFRSKVGLVRHVTELERREGFVLTPAARGALANLPEWIEARALTNHRGSALT